LLFPIFLFIFADMTYPELWRRLLPMYEEGEAKAIVRLVLETRFGLSLADICAGKVTHLSQDDGRELEDLMQGLALGHPVQYVLGEALFAGRTFRVTPDVLIPRPETEELCQWVVQTLSSTSLSHPRILDIGTGSGCIAITLAQSLPSALVCGWDISKGALAVARENADRWGSAVELVRQDALHAPTDKNRWDVIVSNPPYICHQEREAMAAHVLEHEPHSALFVPDDDPLLFYRSIARYALSALRPGGQLFFEINPLYAESLQRMLEEMDWRRVETRHDAFGRQRMMRADRP